MKVINDHCSEFPIKQLEKRSLKNIIQKKNSALNFFQASLFQLLKLEIHCDDHLTLSLLVVL